MVLRNNQLSISIYLTPSLPKSSLSPLFSFKPSSSSLSSFLSASLAASCVFALPVVLALAAALAAAALAAAALAAVALAVTSSLYYLLTSGLTPSLKALAYRRLN